MPSYDDSTIELLKRSLVPSDTCLLCGKEIKDIGGKRIIAQSFRGITLDPKFKGGGNAKYPYQSIKLYDDQEIYVVVWGDKNEWTLPILEKAREEFLNGKRPWFCQACGHRTCSECGSLLNLPKGSDVIDDNGNTTHIGIYPFNSGCNNPKCEAYRQWGDNDT
jgi:hypothetical protein